MLTIYIKRDNIQTPNKQQRSVYDKTKQGKCDFYSWLVYYKNQSPKGNLFGIKKEVNIYGCIPTRTRKNDFYRSLYSTVSGCCLCNRTDYQ